MLTIERKRGQSVFLTLANGQRIKIYVAKANRFKTTLGIEAPRTIQIDREELLFKTN